MDVEITIDASDLNAALDRIDYLLSNATPITSRVATEVLPSAIEDNFAIYLSNARSNDKRRAPGQGESSKMRGTC
jgi:hypothetical protein